MKKLILTNLVLIAIVCTLLLGSCAKDQMALNKLAGTWVYTGVNIYGISVDLSSIGYTAANLHFDDCNAKDLLCDGAQNLGGYPTPFKYLISDDGKSINVYGDSSKIDVYTIKKLTKSELIYTATLSGIVLEFNLKK